MKKLLFLLILALVTIGANAQGQGGPRQFKPEDMAKRQAERVKEVCSTNDEQYKAIYELYLAQSKKMTAQMDSIRALGNNGGQMRFNPEEMQKRQEEMNAKIKEILTEEQYAKYEEMQKQRQRGFGGPRGPRRNQ